MNKNELRRWLKEKNVQKRLNYLAKKYDKKNIVLYGIGLMSSILFEDYDMSKISLVGIADSKYYEKSDFFGYKVINPNEIFSLKPDVIFIATYNEIPIQKYLNECILPEKSNVEIISIVKKNIIDKFIDFLAED